MSLPDASIRQASTQRVVTLDRGISLLDNVKQEDLSDGIELDGESLSRPATTIRIGRERLRENLARRKYAKYQKERYGDDDEEEYEAPATNTRSTTATTISELHRSGTTQTGKDGKKDSRLRRGHQKVKNILGRKRSRRTRDGETEIDILWENQRGTYLFGRPYYSSQSLLNFDPPAWTNVHGQPSPVDITNAQLPDPHWEWSWKSWYVDMSMDVDEQGWQYSFMFQSRFPWHGTHPWGYSFARRRRWIRKRVRKHHHLPQGGVDSVHGLKEAHRLNADYFTIHPTRNRSPDSSYPSSTIGPQNIDAPPQGEDGSEGIDNIRDLLQGLKKATMDREKTGLVLRFMQSGGQDLHYLAGEMPHIMSLFMYQYSRRHLLTAMLRRFDQESPDRSETHTPAEDASSAPQGVVRSDETPGAISNDVSADQRTKDLKKAIEAADEQVRHFEYWSDIRGVVQNGQSLTAADETHGWDSSWQGIDKSGPSSGPDALHTLKPESSTDHDTIGNKGKGKA